MTLKIERSKQVKIPLSDDLRSPKRRTAGEDFPVQLPHQSRDLESKKKYKTHNSMLQNYFLLYEETAYIFLTYLLE